METRKMFRDVVRGRVKNKAATKVLHRGLKKIAENIARQNKSPKND